MEKNGRGLLGDSPGEISVKIYRAIHGGIPEGTSVQISAGISEFP